MSSSGISGLSTAGITFGGLASGLNTSAIIQALMAVEQRPITLLQNKKAGFQTQKSLFSDLEQKLQALQDAADDVRTSSSFLEYEATTSEPGHLSATASSGATAGSYSLRVSSLAKAQVSHSGSYNSASNPEILGSASSKLTFTVGSNSPVDVAISNQTNSLDDVATAINDAGIGIQASVLQTAPNDYKLVLTGEVGASKSFTVTGSGTADVIALANDLSSNTASTASDAVFTINGVQVQRESNQISDAIPGVTLNLTAAHAASEPDTVLTISTDTTATGAKIQAFVDAYNTVVDFMEQQEQIDPNTNQATSPLFGDSTLRNIRSSLRGIVGGTVNTGNQAYEMLAQVGVSADRDGRLTFSQSEFDTAVTTDEDAVEALFTDPTSGIASVLYSRTDDYLDTVDGILVTRQKGLDERIRDIDRQIQRGQERLSRVQQSLERRFANLEVLLGQLQSQGAAIANFGASATQ